MTTDWIAFTERTIEEMHRADPAFRPTTFWTPGVERLLADMRTHGLERFKSWPSAGWWFYPRYPGLGDADVEALVALAGERGVTGRDAWLRSALSSTRDARRDLDVVRLTWNQQRWPFPLTQHGESSVGSPPQQFALAGQDGPRWTKPYLNYLLCLAALSRHLRRPVRSFLEIGGGFGVLGEIVMSRDASAQYVDVDIPPLLTVASSYLTTLFPERVRVAEDGTLAPPGWSTCVPSWEVENLSGPFDVFVNSFSFQEMEPDVVERYVAAVCDLRVEYVVSLNSRLGKPKAGDHDAPGVTDPVTSDRIAAMFAERGYVVCSRRTAPLLLESGGELLVMRRA